MIIASFFWGEAGPWESVASRGAGSRRVMCVHCPHPPPITASGLPQTWCGPGWEAGGDPKLSWARALVPSRLRFLPGCPPAPCPQELLLAPALLEQLTCARGSGELGRILTVPQGQQRALQSYRDAACSGQAAARAQRFSRLAAELHNQLDVAKIAQQVRACLPAGPEAHGPRPEEMLGLLGPTAARGCACGWVSHAPLVSHAPCPPPVCFPAPSQCSLLPPEADSPSASCIPACVPRPPPDLSLSPSHQPGAAPSPSWACISPPSPFPISWAWTPPTPRLLRSSSLHPRSGCRPCWRTCWTPRKFCRMWTSSRPWPCCCPRAPAPAVPRGPQPAALEGQRTARGLQGARAPTPPRRRAPGPRQPPPPQTRCRVSAPPSCSSGPACSPSCAATTGRWAAGQADRKADGAGLAPRSGSEPAHAAPTRDPGPTPRPSLCTPPTLRFCPAPLEAPPPAPGHPAPPALPTRPPDPP